VAGAVLLVVSRGIIEADYRGEEFGLEGAQQALQGAVSGSARDVCLTILQAAQEFMRVPLTHNDVTTIALLREGQLWKAGSGMTWGTAGNLGNERSGAQTEVFQSSGSQ
jgi:hypothetical protein